MTQIAVQPLVLKDMIMQIDVDTFEKAISAATFTPTASTTTWQGGTPDSTFTDVSIAAWSCALTYAQDWDNAASLSRYLFNNEGQRKPALFRPRNGQGASFTATLVLTPGAIGGTVGPNVQEGSVTLGCQGRPVLVPAVAAVPVITSADKTGGPIAGGTLVKLTGSGFTGATAVKFGTVSATIYTIDNDGTIYVVAPAAAAGSKPITVTNATGVSTTSAPYTYA